MSSETFKPLVFFCVRKCRSVVPSADRNTQQLLDEFDVRGPQRLNPAGFGGSPGCFFSSSAPLRLTSSLCHQSAPTTAEWIAMKFDRYCHNFVFEVSLS